MMPELFPLMDVTDMHLDSWQLDRLQGVQKGHAVMGIGGRVNDDAVKLAVSLLDKGYQFPFQVALFALYFYAQLLRRLADISD